MPSRAEETSAFVEDLGDLLAPGGDVAARRVLRALDDGPALAIVQARTSPLSRRPDAVVAATRATLALATAGGRDSAQAWPLADVRLLRARAALAGRTLSLALPHGTLTLRAALPLEASLRLEALLAGRDPEPAPVARLGAAATLRRDRLELADGRSWPLGEGVAARFVGRAPTPSAGGYVNALLRRERPSAGHVVVDGPGWSCVIDVPAGLEDRARTFAAAIDRAAASG